MTDLMEDLSAKKVDSYNKTKDVSATPTISVWGREPYHFQFSDNFYFKDGNLVETVLMRLTRGSTLKGYSGFQTETQKENYKVIKPLIYATKEDIDEYNKQNNIPSSIHYPS